jgi:hypothetical protein
MNQGKRLNNDSLLEILCTSETPTAVYSGEEIRIELANAAMLKAWGKGPEVIGGTLAEALPEITSHFQKCFRRFGEPALTISAKP